MSDYEINNIKNFVYNGGVLIAGDNVGRNMMNGNDRISLYKQLTPENWGLSECFGTCMSEKNMKDYQLYFQTDSTSEMIKDFSPVDLWMLVSDSIHSTDVKALGYWKNNETERPAFIQNDFGKGISFLLPSSYYLHPANDGGYWSVEEIFNFYALTLEAFNKKNNNNINLNIWPDGFDQAFCLSINATGTYQEFKRLDNYLSEKGIPPTYFVNGLISNKVKKLLQNKNVQSNGYSRLNFSQNLYPVCKNDIQENELFWNKEFTGFRFPYSRPNYWGIVALNELGYNYESSIGADNQQKNSGCIFPYHIPISNHNYYKTTTLLEISPSYHDDYHFFSDLIKDKSYTFEKQQKDSKLFSQYLVNYWKYVVKPYHGLMVTSIHPNYTGHNDSTVKSLDQIISIIQDDNTWITTMDDLSRYWQLLSTYNFNVQNNSQQYTIQISSSAANEIKGLSLRLSESPKNIELKNGKYKTAQIGDNYYIIFDAKNDQVLKFSLE
jgi:hypothetical protein